MYFQPFSPDAVARRPEIGSERNHRAEQVANLPIDPKSGACSVANLLAPGQRKNLQRALPQAALLEMQLSGRARFHVRSLHLLLFEWRALAALRTGGKLRSLRLAFDLE